MAIYWNKKGIPEWAALPEEERSIAMNTVIRRVWSHWQVCLPFAINLSAFIAFIFFGPNFEYKLIVVAVLACLTTPVALLPFHSYLRKYLIEYQRTVVGKDVNESHII